MKIEIKTTMEFEPMFLIVKAGVRYWEDATINGVKDTNGVIPFRDRDYWRPKIELKTGKIVDWPKVSAKIHYKVCDDGEYWLDDGFGKKVKWNGCYVPDKLLCVGDEGYGDYIILDVVEDGLIKGWKEPKLRGDEWEVVT